MKFTFSKLILTSVAIVATLTLAACSGGSDSTSTKSSDSNTVNVSNKKTIAPEKLGANGEYDENALAKKVAKALDSVPDINGLAKVYVAQQGSAIFLKGNVPDRNTLEKIVSVVKSVQSVGDINTDGITLK
ncbi:MAG: hypothetical protein QNJ70_30830 [Xenococcaceae cyanobacterium MO_207.B15]|nr:hypothetical protein [Xenococcaceae cyanobacterium MO_207.B15]